MADPSLIEKQIKTPYWKRLTNLLISAVLCAVVAVKSNLAQKLPTSVVIGPGDVFRVSKHMFCDASAVSFEASLSDFKSAVQLSPAMPMNVWPASKQVQLKTNVGNCSLVSVLPPAEEFNFAQRIVVLCENKDLYLMELQEDIGQTTIKQGPLFVTKSLEKKHVCIGMSFTVAPRPSIYVICRPADTEVQSDNLKQVPTSTIKLAIFKVAYNLLEIELTATVDWTYPSSEKAEDFWIIGETTSGSEEVVVQDKTQTVNFTYLYLYSWGRHQIKILKESGQGLVELQTTGQLVSTIQEKSILDVTAFNNRMYVTLTKSQQISMLVCDAFHSKDGSIKCESEYSLSQADPYQTRINIAGSASNPELVSVSLVTPTQWREWQYQTTSKSLTAKAQTEWHNPSFTIDTVQAVQLIGNVGYLIGSFQQDLSWAAVAFNLTTPNDVRYSLFGENRQITTFLSFYRRNSDEKTFLYSIVNRSIEFWEAKFERASTATVSFNQSGPSSVEFGDLQLKCVGGTDPKSFTVKVAAQPSSNSRSTLSFGEVSAYLGQAQITVQTNNKNVSGNAVSTQLLQSVEHNLTMMAGHVNLISPFYSGPNMTNILGVKSLGDDVVLIHNASTIHFLRCRQAPKSLWYMCNYASRDYFITGEKFVNAFMVDKIMFLITKFRDPQNPSRDITKFRGVKLDTAEQTVETKVFPFTTQRADFAVQGSTLFVYVLVSGTADDDRNKIHQMKMELSSKTFGEFKEINANWGEYFWPSNFAINPHDASEIYVLINPIATVTVKVSVFRLKVKPDMTVEHFPNTFELDSSFKVSICAMKANGTFAIIDYTNTVVQYVNLSRTHYHHYQIPLRELGSENIQGHNCDADNGVVQVVGNTESMIGAKLYTIRLNSSTTDIGNRIHSAVAIGNKYTRVTTMFNEFSDEMVTVLFGSSTAELSLVSLKVYGPHLYLNSSKHNKTGKFSLTYAASYPGKAPKNLQAQSKVTLIPPVLDPQVKSKSASQPTSRVTEDKMISLEDFLEITGPYSGLNTDTPSSAIKEIQDRVALSKDNPFVGITQTFDDIATQGTFLLGGIRTSSSQSKVQLYEKSSMVLEKSVDGGSITSLAVIESESQTVAFALVRRNLLKDLLMVFSRSKDTQQWNTELRELDEQGFKTAEFRLLNPESKVYLCVAYKNKASNQVYILPVKISGSSITWSAAYSLYHDVKITELEVSVLRGCSPSQLGAYLIVGLLNEETSRLSRIQVGDKGLDTSVTDLGMITVGADWNVHQNTTLKCEEYFKTKLNCFKSSNNAESYLTAVDGLGSCVGPEGEAKVYHTARLANVVNLRPIKADVAGDQIAVVARNDYPSDSTDLEPGSTVSLFKDNYLLLVYRILPETDLRQTVQPFRVLLPSDLGSTTKLSLSKLTAKLVQNVGSEVWMFVNVGADSASVRLHTLNKLQLRFNPDKLSENTTLEFKQLNGALTVLNLSTVFNLSAPNNSNSSNKTEPDPSKNKTDDNTNKKTTPSESTSTGLPTLPTIMIGSLLIVGALAAGYFLGKKSSDAADEDTELSGTGHDQVKGSMLENSTGEDYFVPDAANNKL